MGFVDVSIAPLTLVPNLSQGVAWADLDNDGDLDLYIVEGDSSNRMLRNDGAAGFTLLAGVAADPGAGSATALADFDRDGRIDIYVGNTAEPNVLYRNLDGAQFQALTTAPLNDTGSAGGVAWGDYDGDGDDDLYVTNIGEPNRLLRNDSGTLVDVTPPALLGVGPTTSAQWVDYDNDLDLDLSIVGFFVPGLLFRNDGPAGFVEVAAGTPLADPDSGFVALWGDFDNDGDQDLHRINHLSPNRTFRNDGNGVFVDVTGPEAALGAVATDASLVDIDLDGDLDLYLCDGSVANRMYRNEQSTSNHWIQLVLEGTASNRSAIGAKVIVTTGTTSQLRVVEGANGFHSQSSLDVEFGLGTATVVDTIEIRWPSGAVQLLSGVAVDQRLFVVEEIAFVRGDVNADGSFNLADAVAVLGYLFLGETIPCDAAADTNDDDAINLVDAVAALNALFASGQTPAQPFPVCGVDPTPGTLGCASFAGCP